MTIDSKNYVGKAESVIKTLINKAMSEAKAKNKRDYNILSTSQIRKQLSMTAELFTQAQLDTSDTLSEDLQSKIEYLRVQFVYQAGREPDVKAFIIEAGILENLKSIGGSKADFLLFCRYMEALVAYRKFLGKTDK